MSDLFREIDQELRQDRAMAFLSRYGIWLAGGAIALVLVITGSLVMRDMKQDANARLTAELIQITGTGLYGDDTRPDPARLQEYGQNHKGELAVLARIRAAGALAEKGADTDAIKVYQELLQKPALDPVLKNYIRYLMILRQTDHEKPDSLIASLQPLTEDRIWGPAARELSAILEFRAGRVDSSVKKLETLQNDTTIPPGIRLRAGELMALYSQSLPAGANPPNS